MSIYVCIHNFIKTRAASDMLSMLLLPFMSCFPTGGIYCTTSQSMRVIPSSVFYI